MGTCQLQAPNLLCGSQWTCDTAMASAGEGCEGPERAAEDPGRIETVLYPYCYVLLSL